MGALEPALLAHAPSGALAPVLGLRLPLTPQPRRTQSVWCRILRMSRLDGHGCVGACAPRSRTFSALAPVLGLRLPLTAQPRRTQSGSCRVLRLSRRLPQACVAGCAPRSRTLRCARLRCSPAPSPETPAATNAVGFRGACLGSRGDPG